MSFPHEPRPPFRAPATREPARSGAASCIAVLLLCGLSGCRVAQAKIYNLNELHDAESHHRYNAALQGDLEYLIRHEIFGLFRAAGARLATKDDARVDAPADACLENLIELEEIDSGNPVIAGRQVEWFARLAVEDPWQLSRERAVLALTAAGVRLKAGLPSALGSDQQPADAETLAAVLTPLVRALRGVLEKDGSRADLEAACAAVRVLDLDMAGARRALAFVVSLQQGAGTRDPDVGPLAQLSLDLQRVCVRRALSRALDDPSPIVRAAALRSAARIGGRATLDTVLFDRVHSVATGRGAREEDPRVLVAIFDALEEAAPLSDTAARGERTRDEWLAAVYGVLLARPEESVRVHAMQALSRIAGAGLTSLREEDWQAWWNDRRPTGGGGAGAAR